MKRLGNPLRIVEIRDLDGPNLFMMAPSIKIELGDVASGQEDDVIAAISNTVAELHESVGLAIPHIQSMRMESPNQVGVAFEWNRRAFARSLGTMAAQLVIGDRSDRDQVVEELRDILAQQPDEDDAPMLARASEDRIPIVAVTGTNGKTTTSRLIDFVLRHAGFNVGLTSSAGVYINNEQVLEGDYSGPSGARRVLSEPGIEYAVLETARGGLLLRGSGFEAADVAVVTNVAEDHLGLHGIHTVEGLAAVKAIVARNAKPGGFCVLNANNRHTLAMRDITPGEPVLFSSTLESGEIRAHIAAGGTAISVDSEKNVVWYEHGESTVITSLAEIPMTFDGKATHQVENALAAIAALIGLGLPVKQIREGVAAFRSTAEYSKGRLNVYEVNGGTVIIDFAHNEAGLAQLLAFARNYKEGDGRLIAVIGTAGDRDNQSLRGIARRAVLEADVVVMKDSVRYLRGRKPGEMLAEMRAAIEEIDRPGIEIREAPDERTATFMMVDEIQENDVVAVMCVEDYDFILKKLSKIGVDVA